MILSNITISGGMTFVATGATPPASIVTDGLKFELDAGNTSSYPGFGNVWTDLTGNNFSADLGPDGPSQIPSWSSDNQGYFTFDGTNDIMSMPNTDDSGFIEGFTAATWNSMIWVANVATDGNPGKGTLFSYGYNSTNDTVFGIYRGNISCQINNGANGSSTYPLPALETWINLCIVYDGSQSNNTDKLKLYINGVQQTWTSMDTLPSSISSIVGFPARIGQYFGALEDFDFTYAGRLAYASMYSRALSGAEVTQNFNALKGRYGL